MNNYWLSRIMLFRALIASLGYLWTDRWRFPKQVDYSLICVPTMHHLENYQFCIIVRFCFRTELHLYMHASAFRMIPWFSAGLTNSTHTIFSRVSNVVNCGYSWYEMMRCLRQEELLHLSIHNLTWQESNIGRFVNHNISIQSKIVQEVFEDV